MFLALFMSKHLQPWVTKHGEKCRWCRLYGKHISKE